MLNCRTKEYESGIHKYHNITTAGCGNYVAVVVVGKKEITKTKTLF